MSGEDGRGREGKKAIEGGYNHVITSDKMEEEKAEERRGRVLGETEGEEG